MEPPELQAQDLAAEQEAETEGMPETEAAVAVNPETAAPDAGTPGPAVAGETTEVRRREPPLEHLQSLPPELDLLARARPDASGRLTVRTREGERVLTVDAALQRELTRLLESYNTPHAAVVVLEPGTGRVLAMAEHSHGQPGLRGLAVRAAFPAASIFKIVTGSALLKKGLAPDTEECFHGGKRRLKLALLQDSARDSLCYSLALAMGKSANVVFAKLTSKHLSAEDLRREAELFGFNRPLHFDVPTDVSPAVIPDGGFALAETGAGFGDVYLSPLHGALMTAVVANGGRWQDAVLLEPPESAGLAPDAMPARELADGIRLDGAGGSAFGEPLQVMTPELAKAMTDMLEETVTRGTARRVFRQRGFQVDGAVGKTGTLADRTPFRDYSWFVGFAPRDAPRVVVAAVVANGPIWRIRAPFVGREAMRMALQRQARGDRALEVQSATAPGAEQGEQAE
jgi:penicillin-binding protein A